MLMRVSIHILKGNENGMSIIVLRRDYIGVEMGGGGECTSARPGESEPHLLYTYVIPSTALGGRLKNFQQNCKNMKNSSQVLCNQINANQKGRTEN